MLSPANRSVFLLLCWPSDLCPVLFGLVRCFVILVTLLDLFLVSRLCLRLVSFLLSCFDFGSRIRALWSLLQLAPFTLWAVPWVGGADLGRLPASPFPLLCLAISPLLFTFFCTGRRQKAWTNKKIMTRSLSHPIMIRAPPKKEGGGTAAAKRRIAHL